MPKPVIDSFEKRIIKIGDEKCFGVRVFVSNAKRFEYKGEISHYVKIGILNIKFPKKYENYKKGKYEVINFSNFYFSFYTKTKEKIGDLDIKLYCPQTIRLRKRYKYMIENNKKLLISLYALIKTLQTATKVLGVKDPHNVLKYIEDNYIEEFPTFYIKEIQRIDFIVNRDYTQKIKREEFKHLDPNIEKVVQIPELYLEKHYHIPVQNNKYTYCSKEEGKHCKGTIPFKNRVIKASYRYFILPEKITYRGKQYKVLIPNSKAEVKEIEKYFNVQSTWIDFKKYAFGVKYYDSHKGSS